MRTLRNRHGDAAGHAAAADDGFDGVGDDFARDEGIPFAAHRDAVGDGDGIENDGLAATFVHALFGFEREFINVHVARRDVAPRRSDTDDGLFEIGHGEADGIKHGARGGAFRAVEQHARMGTQILCGNLFYRRIVAKQFWRGKAAIDT